MKPKVQGQLSSLPDPFTMGTKSQVVRGSLAPKKQRKHVIFPSFLFLLGRIKAMNSPLS